MTGHTRANHKMARFFGAQKPTSCFVRNRQELHPNEMPNKTSIAEPNFPASLISFTFSDENDKSLKANRRMEPCIASSLKRGSELISCLQQLWNNKNTWRIVKTTAKADILRIRQNFSFRPIFSWKRNKIILANDSEFSPDIAVFVFFRNGHRYDVIKETKHIRRPQCDVTLVVTVQLTCDTALFFSLAHDLRCSM